MKKDQKSRKGPKIYSLTFIGILLLIISIFMKSSIEQRVINENFVNNGIKNGSNNSNNNNHLNAVISGSDSPIEILENGDFEGVTSEGNGDPGTPYIIENLHIIINSGYGISIEGTDKYFVIRNCTITLAENVIMATYGTYTGIYIDSIAAGNARIYNNTLKNLKMGIYVIFADNSVIRNNSFYYNSYAGINLRYSSSSIIANNTFIQDGLEVDGNSLGQYLTYTVENNTINGLPIGYFKQNENIKLTTSYGQLFLYDCKNITIKNQNCSYAKTGITLQSCDECKILDSLVTNNPYLGFNLDYCSNSEIMNNTIYSGLMDQHSVNSYIFNNSFINAGIFLFDTEVTTTANNTFEECGLNVHCDSVIDYLSQTIENNTVNSLPLGYFKNTSDLYLADPYGQLILINCSKATIRNQNCSYARGIYLYSCLEATIFNNTCNNNNDDGIELIYCNSSLIFNNTINRNGYAGLSVIYCNTSIIEKNTCYDNDIWHIKIADSYYSIIQNNTCTKNAVGGIYIKDCGFTTTRNNTLYKTGNSGIYIDGSYNCSIYWNALIENPFYGVNIENTYPSTHPTENNTIFRNTFALNGWSSSTRIDSQGYDEGSDNQWLNQTLQEGNYWDNYNGSGDYPIDGSADVVDSFPLNSMPVPIPNKPPSINHPENITFSEGSAGKSIIWIPVDIDDEFSLNYTIFVNDEIVQFDDCTSEGEIILDLDDFKQGIYNITIIVEDRFSQCVQDTVWVTITQKQPTEISSSTSTPSTDDSFDKSSSEDKGSPGFLIFLCSSSISILIIYRKIGRSNRK